MSRANREVKKHIKTYPDLLKQTLYSRHIFGKNDPTSQIEKLNKIFDFIYPGRTSPNRHFSEHAQPLSSNLSTALSVLPSTMNARQLCLILLCQWLAIELIKDKASDKQYKQTEKPLNNPVAQHLLHLLNEKITQYCLRFPEVSTKDEWQKFKQSLFALKFTPAFQIILQKAFPKVTNTPDWFTHMGKTLSQYPLEITANPSASQASKPSAADMTVTAATAAADLQMRQEAEEKAKREAAAAQAKAQKEATEQAKREAAAAQAKAQKEAAEQAKREAAAAQAKAQKEAVEPEPSAGNDIANREAGQQSNNLVSLGAMIQRQKELGGIGTSPSPLSNSATAGTPNSGPATPAKEGLPSTATSSASVSVNRSPRTSPAPTEEAATTTGLETAGSPAVKPSSGTVRALQSSGSPLHARPPKPNEKKRTQKVDAPCHGKCSIL